eukprot:scaffold31653_cov82-Phaeocystis_antarctica.AAC.2
MRRLRRGEPECVAPRGIQTAAARRCTPLPRPTAREGRVRHAPPPSHRCRASGGAAAARQGAERRAPRAAAALPPVACPPLSPPRSPPWCVATPRRVGPASRHHRPPPTWPRRVAPESSGISK